MEVVSFSTFLCHLKFTHHIHLVLYILTFVSVILKSRLLTQCLGYLGSVSVESFS